MKNKINGKGKIAWFIFLLLTIIIICIPMYIIFKYSISDKSSWVTGGKYPVPWWPFHTTFQNIAHYLTDQRFLNNAIMSLKIAFLTVIISTVVSVPAAYVLSRYKFPMVGTILLILLSARLIPDVSAAVPVAKIFADSILYKIPTVLKIAITHSTFGIPYMIFVVQGIFQNIPKDLDEQAYIMGTSKMYAFTRIVTPLAVPGIAASAIYIFMLSWNEFLYAYYITSTSASKVIPLSVYMKTLFGVSSPSPVQLSVISLLISTPVILVTFFIQKYIVAGATEGAVK